MINVFLISRKSLVYIAYEEYFSKQMFFRVLRIMLVNLFSKMVGRNVNHAFINLTINFNVVL
jgi:hypothetical protein